MDNNDLTKRLQNVLAKAKSKKAAAAAEAAKLSRDDNLAKQMGEEAAIKDWPKIVAEIEKNQDRAYAKIYFEVTGFITPVGWIYYDSYTATIQSLLPGGFKVMHETCTGSTVCFKIQWS